MLVCCWRGGLRSRSVTTLLRMVGYKAFQLQGGYKSYRNHVISYFEHFVPPAMLVVIHGMTGVGKTTFINRLDKNCFSTIDLEAVAQHRGSAFGSVGQQQHHTQKRFETLLWDLFRNVPNGRPLILEGESQRIGKLLLPGTMYTVMANSMKIWCHASLETRVERLIAEYGTDDYRQQIGEALDRIRKKLGGACHAELSNLLKTGDLQRVARGLIQEYYDKIYYKHRSWISDIELELEDFATAEKQLKMYLSRIIPESAHSPSSSSMANAKFFARPDGAITP
jgi:tRNA 2-selenouridine synthase